jgi:hypothetical protein
MVFYFSIFILKLLWHVFLVHIFHFIYVTNLMSSFQKSIMNPLFSKNSSIFFYTIPNKVYCKIDN